MRRKLVSATYDYDSGELGSVTWGKEFEGENDLLKADVLGDLKGVVDTLYEKHRKKATKGLSPEAKIQLGHPDPDQERE